MECHELLLQPLLKGTALPLTVLLRHACRIASTKSKVIPFKIR